MKRRLRQALLSIVDRFEFLRTVLAHALASVARNRGANSAVLAEAVHGARARPAHRTAEMVMWAGAVEGIARFPAHFVASRMLTTPQARADSVDALRRRSAGAETVASALAQATFLRDDPSAFAEARRRVEDDLGRQLSDRAVRGRRGHPIERSRQIETLRTTIACLDDAGLRPFLVSGTLLGQVRHGRLMAHDYDIDLGVLPGEGDVDTVVAALSRLDGFSVEAQDYKAAASRPSGFGVDVFIHYERDGLLWHGTDVHEWWNTPFDLVRTMLDGTEVWAPDDPQKYLDENYGNWSRPVAFYNFAFDTPNHRYRYGPDALAYLYRECVQALAAEDRWTVESTLRELRDNFGVDTVDRVSATPLLGERRTRGDG